MKSLASLLFVSSAVLIACVDPSTELAPKASTEVRRFGKTGPLADSVRLAMRVTDLSTYQVQSDGLGEYLHGIAGMVVLIDATGNLQITPANATGTLPPVRRLNVSYASGLRWTFPKQVNFKIKSNKTNNGNPRIQDMAVGSALCFNVTIAHRDDAVQFVDTFNPAAYPSSSYALVTRISSTAWTVESRGVATGGFACGAPDTAWVTWTDLLAKRGGSFTVGAEAQAFHIDLRALP